MPQHTRAPAMLHPVGVESTVGVGSVFWFELGSVAAPRLAVDRAEPATIAHVHPRPGAPLGTLLYVEDNTANLKLVEQLIARRPDMRLLSALNGKAGIEMARRSLPDVILMDINLPGISGIQALKTLREDPVTAHIPVLAISANAMPGDIKKGLESRILPLSHQADQPQRVPGCDGCGVEMCRREN
jgi:CheY-like chemotaxis protein